MGKHKYKYDGNGNQLKDVGYNLNGRISSTKTKKYDWERFKQLSKLDKKFDETLTEYYSAFLDMCEKLTGKKRR